MVITRITMKSKDIKKSYWYLLVAFWRCFIFVHVLHRGWNHGGMDKPEVRCDPCEHGRVRTLARGHPETSGAHQDMLVFSNVDHQGPTTVTLKWKIGIERNAVLAKPGKLTPPRMVPWKCRSCGPWLGKVNTWYTGPEIYHVIILTFWFHACGRMKISASLSTSEVNGRGFRILVSSVYPQPLINPIYNITKEQILWYQPTVYS